MSRNTGFLPLEPGDRFTSAVTHTVYPDDGPADSQRRQVEVMVVSVERHEQLDVTHIEGVIIGGGNITIKVTPAT